MAGETDKARSVGVPDMTEKQKNEILAKGGEGCARFPDIGQARPGNRPAGVVQGWRRHMSGTSEEKIASGFRQEDPGRAQAKVRCCTAPTWSRGSSILFSTLFLFYAASHLQVKVNLLLDEASQIHERPFADVWYRLSTIAVGALWDGGAADPRDNRSSAILATNVAITKGFVFSAKPVEPDFSRINPAAGAEAPRPHSRALSSSARHCSRFVALSVAFSVVFHAGPEGAVPGAEHAALPACMRPRCRC